VIRSGLKTILPFLKVISNLPVGFHPLRHGVAVKRSEFFRATSQFFPNLPQESLRSISFSKSGIVTDFNQVTIFEGFYNIVLVLYRPRRPEPSARPFPRDKGCVLSACRRLVFLLASGYLKHNGPLPHHTSGSRLIHHSEN